MKTNSEVKYPLLMRLLHWLMAALILFMLISGLMMVSSLQAWQPALLAIHKLTGVMIFGLAVVRVMVKIGYRDAIPATQLPNLQRQLVRYVHIGFYLLMVLLPISGYLMQNFAGRPIMLTDTVILPSLFEPNIAWYGLLRTTHGALALLFASMIIGHLAMALWHHWVKQDRTLAHMR